MTPARLRQCLTALRWSRVTLGTEVGVHERQVRRWEAGLPVPAPIAEWLELLVAFHEAHPAPLAVDRRTRGQGDRWPKAD